MDDIRTGDGRNSPASSADFHQHHGVVDTPSGAADPLVDVRTKLIQDVWDLLDVSSVGLYEFLWILNTLAQPLNQDQRKAIARQCLAELLTQPYIRLVTLRWPHSTVVDVLTPAQLPTDPWGEPDRDGLYIAVANDEQTNERSPRPYGDPSQRPDERRHH